MSDIHIIPQPVSVKPADGQFTLTPEAVIVAPGAAERTGQQLAAALAPATGFWLPVQAASSQAGGPHRTGAGRCTDPASARKATG